MAELEITSRRWSPDIPDSPLAGSTAMSASRLNEDCPALPAGAAGDVVRGGERGGRGLRILVAPDPAPAVRREIDVQQRARIRMGANDRVPPVIGPEGRDEDLAPGDPQRDQSTTHAAIWLGCPPHSRHVAVSSKMQATYRR